MSRFTDFLRDTIPRTGRVIREDGTSWNEADAAYFRDKYSLLSQTIRNGAVEFGKRTNVASADSLNPLYYYLDIPVGRRFYIWSRDLEFTQGRFELDLVLVDSVSGGVPAFKTNLFQGGPDSVQTVALTNVTATGTPQVVMELPLVDTGSNIGGTRAGGAASVQGVLKGYVGGGPPVLIRVQKTDAAADYTASLTLVAWEEAEV